MTPSTIARLLVERANNLVAAHDRRELTAAPTMDMLLAHPSIADGIGFCNDRPARQVGVLLALAAGRSVIGLWQRVFPHLSGPPEALVAAAAWAENPSEVAAAVAANAAAVAVRQSLSVWRGPDQAAAWAGRTAAWVAMAPKYDWPAIDALIGACKAGGSEAVVCALRACLSELCGGRAEPGKTAERSGE
jgi:hypothetical protein